MMSSYLWVKPFTANLTLYCLILHLEFSLNFNTQIQTIASTLAEILTSLIKIHRT